MKRFALNIAGLMVAIVAVLFNLPSLYLMAAILWLIPFVSYGMGWLMLGGLTCERSLPLSATVGEAVTLTYTLGNLSRLPKFYLRVRDSLPRGMSAAGGTAPLVLGLWPGEERETQALIGADRRGVFRIGPAQVYSTDPLGLQTFAQKMPDVSELVVYPAILPLQNSWLRGVAAPGWRGAANALVRGDGDDFYGVREYGPGDELRRVHWRTTARTGKLAVTEYAQGVTLDVTVALDLSQAAYAGTGDDENSALEYAVTLAATLLDDLLRGGHSVRLLSAATLESGSLPARGPEAMPHFLETLARVQADSSKSLADVLESHAAAVGGTATLVTITPEAGSPALESFLHGWSVRGGRHFGLALDAASFRRDRAGLAPPLPPAVPDEQHWRIVRRGDDLRATLERLDDGWS